MSRPAVVLQSVFPYTISARCINQEWFRLDMDVVWEIFSRELLRTSEKFTWKIHSFVLMNNHFHLIASTPDANISECMHSFMGRTSRELSKAGNRINETFAGRHYKCVLDSHFYFLNAYKYNYRNPVAAGVVKNVEDYPFSSLQAVMGKSKLIFPLEPDLTYSSDPTGTLAWLNKVPNPEQWAAARLGFKRSHFRSKKYPRTNKLILGEFDIL